MRGLLKDAGVCLLIFVIILLSFITIDPTSKAGNSGNIDFAYFEDKTGQLKIDDIHKVALQNKFKEKENSKFFWGKSYSVFWIRILVKEASDLKDYLAIYNPNVKNVQLYMPKSHENRIYYSGWENNLIKQDEGLSYPVFNLNHPEHEELVNKPIYLRIQSDYLHDYVINFYSQGELNRVRNIGFCIDFMLFGVLLTIFITSMIIFFKLRNKICLIFAFSILFLTMHQGSLTGIYNIIPNQYSSFFMSLSIETTSLFLASIIVFFIVYSNIKVINRKYYYSLVFLIGFILIGGPLCYIDKIAANTFSYLSAAITVAAVLYCALRLHLTGAVNLRCFLLGWDVLAFLCIVVLLRSEGIWISNYVVINLYFFSVVLIYIVFAIAVIEHTRGIFLKNIEMGRQYKIAAEQVKHTEIALLQTQIKPHFLYNTLAAIERLCDIDPQKAKAAIIDLADYLRGNIDFSVETRLVSIERELENIRCYLSLEKMRFDDRLRVSYDIKAIDFMLPPLVVQPIVENAVRHGITKKREGGTVHIAVGETEKDYVITVEDDGVGFIPNQISDSNHPSIGINNVRSRLNQQCRGELIINSQIGQGTKVFITIPKR